jgi:hypothetical protein
MRHQSQVPAGLEPGLRAAGRPPERSLAVYLCAVIAESHRTGQDAR